MADVVVSQSSIHGTGVFAIRDFSTGEIVLTIDDSRVVDDDHPLDGRCGEYAVHCDYLAKGGVVLMAVPERFINSSCNPNTYVRTLEGSRRVIASRSIQAGDEVTYDYIVNNHGGDIWECRCGTAECRRIMPSSFFDLPTEEQRRLRPFLDAWFVHEHRPRLERLRIGGHSTPMQLQSSHVETLERTARAGPALLSAFIPGLGQLIQRRFWAAGIQFGTVAAYLVGALGLGGRRALLLALCWSVWSVIDAYRHEAD